MNNKKLSEQVTPPLSLPPTSQGLLISKESLMKLQQNINNINNKNINIKI